MQRLRIGFIGCGRHATKALYPSLRYTPIELVAVCDIDDSRARRNARWFGAERWFTDHREMLEAGGLDAVIIVTGPETHAALATDALETGLPVFVEKPPALGLADAEALQATSLRLGKPVSVGMMKRYAHAYAHLKDLIEDDGFGPLSHVSSTFRLGAKRSSGYAFLLDAGIHHLDLLRHLAGEYQIVSSERRGGVEGITYALLLRFESGAVGSVHLSDQGSWLGPVEWVEVTGAGQVARAENLVHVSLRGEFGSQTSWEPNLSIAQDGGNTFFLQGYVPELRAWAEALLEGREPPTLIADVCRSMRLITALEPEEDYHKEQVHFAHWGDEDRWMA